MKERRRVTPEQKKMIWNLYQEGLASRKIAEKVGCSFVTVCLYINRIIQSDGVIPTESRKRRTKLSHKPNVSSDHPEQKRKKRVETPGQLEQSEKIRSLYTRLGSAAKVVQALKIEGIVLSAPTILKKVREQANKSIPL
jgi:transposase